MPRTSSEHQPNSGHLRSPQRSQGSQAGASGLLSDIPSTCQGTNRDPSLLKSILLVYYKGWPSLELSESIEDKWGHNYLL